MSEEIVLRPCTLVDLEILLKIYHEGFRGELAFFFRSFCTRFFGALFRLLIRETVVADLDGNVVGFVIVTPSLRGFLGTDLLRLIPTIPKLLVSMRSCLFIYVLQKLRNTKWSNCQVGIGCIVVKKECRGKGIGGALMLEALSQHSAKNAVLDVRVWNESTTRLYSGVGFRRIGAWKDPLGTWIMMYRPKPQYILS